MELPNSQLQTLATHIRTNQTQAVVDALAIRNDNGIAAEYNKSTAFDAWKPAVDGGGIYEAMDITKFDGLTQGKRDAWRLFIDRADIKVVDFSRQRMRKVVIDVWGATADGQAVLTALLEKASVFEMVFNPQDAVTATITGKNRVVLGPVDSGVIGQALNRF